MLKVNDTQKQKARKHGFKFRYDEPTYLYELVDWLRNEKNVHIQIEHISHGWNFFVFSTVRKSDFDCLISGQYANYEFGLSCMVSKILDYMCNPDHNGECLLCDALVAECDLQK